MNLELFEEIVEFPDKAVEKRFNQLVGLDQTITRLVKESRLLFNPNLLLEWSQTYYSKEINLLHYFRKRPPLFIFSGDVGTGKTSLAESFGDTVSRVEKIDIALYRLSLRARGSGTVGEMTKLVSSAFDTILQEGKRIKPKEKKVKNAIILLIDEADALAQSRELAQMHHEDRAGVNALIRGIDTISEEGLPILVVMCTNRLSAIDPAVKRRAAEIFTFDRPNEEQRKFLFEKALGDIEISDKELNLLVEITGNSSDREYGYTYSDITQRLMPSILLEFFPSSVIDFGRVIEMAQKINPTPPFKEDRL